MPIHLTLEGKSYAESKQNYSTALRVFDLIVRRQRNLDEILSHLIDRQLRRERSGKKKENILNRTKNNMERALWLYRW